METEEHFKHNTTAFHPVALRASVEQADTDNRLKGVNKKRGDLETERH